MADKADLLDYPRVANSALYELRRVKDALAAIYQALQVLVCAAFHVLFLVHLLFQGDGGGAGVCLPELQGLLLRVSILIFFLFSRSSFFFQADIVLLVMGVLFSAT